MSAKVQKITDFITKKRTTPTAYIKAYVLQEFEDQTGRGIQRAATTRRQKNFAQMIVADEEFRNIINENEDGVAIHTEEEMIEQLLKQLCDELSSLESSTAFSSWQVSDEWNGRPSFESINFKKAIRDIEETAPTWARLVCDVTRNKRADWNSYTASKSKSQQPEEDSSSIPYDYTGILYLMTTAVMYQRARQTANRAAVDLGLYLEANGTKDRVITFLSRLGLCPSIDTIRKRRADITKYSEVCTTTAYR